MLTIPPRSDFGRSVCPVTDIFLLKNSATPTRLVSLRLRNASHFSPIAFPFYFSLAGRFLNLVWAMGLGQASSKKKLRNSKCKYKFNRCLRSSYHIVSVLKGIHPRHPPREFPLGLRAPVLGSGTFSNGSNTGKRAVQEKARF